MGESVASHCPRQQLLRQSHTTVPSPLIPAVCVNTEGTLSYNVLKYPDIKIIKFYLLWGIYYISADWPKNVKIF